MIFTQQNSIKDLLARAKMVDGKGVVTPTLATTKLSEHGPDTFRYPHMHRSIVSALQ